jgi:hypothetical protein
MPDLKAKTDLGFVFVREELKDFPAALELLETLAERVDQLEAKFGLHEAITKPRPTPAWGTKPPEEKPPEKRTASDVFANAVKKLPPNG